MAPLVRDAVAAWLTARGGRLRAADLTTPPRWERPPAGRASPGRCSRPDSVFAWVHPGELPQDFGVACSVCRSSSCCLNRVRDHGCCACQFVSYRSASKRASLLKRLFDA